MTTKNEDDDDGEDDNKQRQIQQQLNIIICSIKYRAYNKYNTTTNM